MVMCREISPNEISNRQVTEVEARAIGAFILNIVSLFFVSDIFRHVRTRNKHADIADRGSVCRRVIAWTTGLLAVNAAGLTSHDSRSVQAHGVAADAYLSPIAASAILMRIVQRRRNQLRNREIPDMLTVTELDALSRIRKQATQATGSIENIELSESTPDVRTVLAAVDRISPIVARHEVVHTDTPWIIEVKLFGYPMAVSVDGNVVEFRKKRSLELLTWLTLNRDRARRSTARTAMWDVDVSDSTFSTVVSDLRRSLRDAVGSDEHQFLPTTYSDELPLSSLIVTDLDRLNQEYQRFLQTHVVSSELQVLLAGMRDIPFAGTTYSWADLDGTTTRLVMSALTVTVGVAQISLDHGAVHEAMVATSAGLRVFPGCEELLEIQQACLQTVSRAPIL